MGYDAIRAHVEVANGDHYSGFDCYAVMALASDPNCVHHDRWAVAEIDVGGLHPNLALGGASAVMKRTTLSDAAAMDARNRAHHAVSRQWVLMGVVLRPRQPLL